MNFQSPRVGQSHQPIRSTSQQWNVQHVATVVQQLNDGCWSGLDTNLRSCGGSPGGSPMIDHDFQWTSWNDAGFFLTTILIMTIYDNNISEYIWEWSNDIFWILLWSVWCLADNGLASPWQAHQSPEVEPSESKFGEPQDEDPPGASPGRCRSIFELYLNCIWIVFDRIGQYLTVFSCVSCFGMFWLCSISCLRFNFNFVRSDVYMQNRRLVLELFTRNC